MVTKTCRFCQHEMKPNAVFCEQCKHYSSRFRNFLPFLGGFVALATVLATASLYVRSQWMAILADSCGSISCDVASVNSEGDIVVRNTGTRTLFFTDVVFNCGVMKDYRALNQTVPPGELVDFAAHPRGVKSNTWRCVTGASAKAVMDGKTLKNLFWQWYSENHPGLSAHFDFYTTHAVTDGSATLYYYGLGDKALRSVDVPCTVYAIQYSDVDGTYSDEIRTVSVQTQNEGSHGSSAPIPQPVPAIRHLPFVKGRTKD